MAHSKSPGAGDGSRADLEAARQEVGRAKESAERQSRRLRLLSDIAAQLQLHETSHALLPSIFERLSEDLGLEVYLHYLVGADGKHLLLSSSAGLPPECLPGIEQLGFGEAVCGTVARERQPWVVEDVQASEEPLYALIRSLGITAYACHPLLSGGKLLGTLSFGTRRRRRFLPDEVELMRTICDQIAISVERSRLIAELRERSREAQAAREAAEAASRAKDQFLAALSHELRTPLTPVLLTTQKLERDPRLPDEVRPEMRRMRRNIERAARLIDDLLDLTRIARGKVPLHPEIVDVHALLRHAAETSSAERQGEGPALRLELQAERSWVWADPARLEQIFWNLIKNALKFTGADGEVRLRTANRSGLLVVEVADTGVGIEPELLPNIFDAGEQGGSSVTRRFGGLGLGLAISKSLVDLHGGRITAASEGRGKGATFTVSLPEAEAPSAEPPGASTGLEPQRPLHLLLVEDHSDTADAMAELLRTRGHRVTVAGTVREAITIVESWKRDGAPTIDLVVSDLGLPDGSGLDLMRELRGRHGLSGIALSGYGMEEDLRESQKAGFAAHLTKPVNLQVLEAAIRDTVEGSGTYTPAP